MLTPAQTGFAAPFTMQEQYQILCHLIDIARDPVNRTQLLHHCRIPGTFFHELLAGKFCEWSSNPVEPLQLSSAWELNILWRWFVDGIKPTPAEIVDSVSAHSRDHRVLSEHAASALWLWLERACAPKPFPQSLQTQWRLRMEACQQVECRCPRWKTVVMISLSDESTGHILAYRFLPSFLHSQGWHFVLHDAMALFHARPEVLLVEFPPTQVYAHMLKKLQVNLARVNPVIPYWANWLGDRKSPLLSIKQLYRHFGLYLERQQRHDPFRQLLERFDVFTRITNDAAWSQGDLRWCLPESIIRFADQEHFYYNATLYRPLIGDPPLPSSLPISLRLSSFSTRYGWVYAQGKMVTRVRHPDLMGAVECIRAFRDWENEPLG
jgi:hypothetical protein